MHLSGEMSACSLSFATLDVVTLIKVTESKNEIKIQNFILENFWKTKRYCYVRVKVAQLDFFGGIPPKFEH